MGAHPEVVEAALDPRARGTECIGHVCVFRRVKVRRCGHFQRRERFPARPKITEVRENNCACAKKTVHLEGLDVGGGVLGRGEALVVSREEVA